MERNRFHNLLSEIGENVIVILSTHIVEDVKNLCKKMVVMNQGTILFEGTPDQSLETIKNKIWRKYIDKEQLNDFRKEMHVISSRVMDGKLAIHVHSDNNPGAGFEGVTPDLEDVYFSNITKK
jgi:ABC-type multidrug transport system ATPase subunit